jgi:hypothetical protein
MWNKIYKKRMIYGKMKDSWHRILDIKRNKWTIFVKNRLIEEFVKI